MLDTDWPAVERRRRELMRGATWDDLLSGARAPTGSEDAAFLQLFAFIRVGKREEGTRLALEVLTRGTVDPLLETLAIYKTAADDRDARPEIGARIAEIAARNKSLVAPRAMLGVIHRAEHDHEAARYLRDELTREAPRDPFVLYLRAVEGQARESLEAIDEMRAEGFPVGSMELMVEYQASREIRDRARARAVYAERARLLGWRMSRWRFESWYWTRYLGWAAAVSAFGGFVTLPWLLAPLTWVFVGLQIAGDRTFGSPWRLTWKRSGRQQLYVTASIVALVAAQVRS